MTSIFRSGSWRVRSRVSFVQIRKQAETGPSQRLKNSRRTSKCQSIGELGTLLRKNSCLSLHYLDKNFINPLRAAPFPNYFYSVGCHTVLKQKLTSTNLM